MQTKFSSETKQNILIDCNRNRRRTLHVAMKMSKCKEKRKWTMNDKDKRQPTSSIGTCIWRDLHLPYNNNNNNKLHVYHDHDQKFNGNGHGRAHRA